MANAKYAYWLTDDGLILIQGWARDGLTNEQIAHNMDISRETLNQWRKNYTAIADTLKKGKDVVDYEVENALLNSAKSGNVTAQIFWLKNRKPDKWRDRLQSTQADNSAISKETIDTLTEVSSDKEFYSFDTGGDDNA